MSRSKTLALMLLCWAIAGTALAATLEEARRLYREGEDLAAREQLLEILALESDGMVRASALDLLAMMAVDRGDLELAAAVWEKLISDFPDSPEAEEARTKQSLATDLAELRSEQPRTATTVPGVEAPSSEPSPRPEAAPREADTAPPPVATEAAATLATAEPAARGAQSKLVLVAGRGTPHDGAQRAAEVVIGHLQSRGVSAESATKGVPVVERSDLVLPALLQHLQLQDGGSLLVVSSDFETLERIVVECYTPEGVLAWKKKVTGGTGWKGRPYSATGMNEKLVERMLDKLDEQVGGGCLPLSR
jgi:hypothetical protein